MGKKYLYPTIDRLVPSKTYFCGPVEEHLLADTIADWFAARGLSPEPTVSNHDFASWTHYDGKERLAYHFGLSRDYKAQVYVTLSFVFALLPLQDANGAAIKLLRRNGWLIAPCKFAVLLIDQCCLKFDSHDQLVTEDSLAFRLKFLFNLAIHSRDDFTQEEFGLVPLPNSWFNTLAAGQR